MNVVIDSSVFIEAIANSVQQKLCLDLLRTIYLNPNINVFEPVLLMYELVIALSRTAKSKVEKSNRLDRLGKILGSFKNRENFNIIDMGYNDWLEWYKSKSNKQPHKSQDEIFMFTAVHNDAILLTLDHEMINNPDCLTGKCKVYAPYDGLKIIEKIK